MSIRMKLSVGVSVLVILVLFATVTFMSRQSLGIIQDNELGELKMLEGMIASKLANQIEATKAMTLSVAHNPEVQRLFAERDRTTLLEQLMPGYEVVRSQYAQMQFHLPDSTSFLRLHQPDRHGDSLRDFRHTVNVSNQTQTVAAGLEEGRGGYGLRVVAPVFYEGRHIGSVEYGGDFGLPFLISLQEELGGEYFIHQLSSSAVAWDEHSADDTGLLVGTRAEDPWTVDSGVIQGLQQGVSQYYISQDKQSSILLHPLQDFQGQVIGFLKVVRDRSAVMSRIADGERTAYLLALIAALISAASLFALQTAFLKPLNSLVAAAAKMGEGDFTGEISYKTNDEIGRVFQALGNVQANSVKPSAG